MKRWQFISFFFVFVFISLILIFNSSGFIFEDYCILDSVTLTPNCAGDKCKEGESIDIYAEIHGLECDSVEYIQVDARDGGCSIEYTGGQMSGIGSIIIVDPGDTSISISWTIPIIHSDCLGDTISGTAAALWSEEPNPDGNGWISGIGGGIGGTFAFIECKDGSTLACPNPDGTTPATGVCAGFEQTCAGDVWPGCDYTSIPDYGDEICDGLDNDCDANTVDGSGETAPDNSLQIGVCSGSKQSCISGSWVDDYSGVDNYEATETSCDGLNNDCDDETDEGCCVLDSATITANCGNEELCSPGESIEISADVSGDCSSIHYIQVDARDGGCIIEYTGGTISGIGSDDLTSGSDSITASWTIPELDNTNACLGQIVSGTASALYSAGVPGTGIRVTGTEDVSGSFRFVDSAGECGNDNVDSGAGEECDGDKWGSFEGCGDFDDCIDNGLACYPPGHEHECMFDISACDCGDPDPDAECGDGNADAGNGEKCDGDDLDGKQCSDFNEFNGDDLACYPPGHEHECMFDTTHCEDPDGPYCGDGVAQLGENCLNCPDDAGCIGDEICHIVDLANLIGECRPADGDAGPCLEDGTSACDLGESCDCEHCIDEQDSCRKGRECKAVDDSYECACDNKKDNFCPDYCPDDPDCEGLCGDGVLVFPELCEYNKNTELWFGCAGDETCTKYDDTLTGKPCDCYKWLENGWILYLSRGKCISTNGREGEQEVYFKVKCMLPNCADTSFPIGDETFSTGSGVSTDDPKTLKTTTERCTLPPEKIPFFTSLNILLVIVILIGYYLYKKKD